MQPRRRERITGIDWFVALVLALLLLAAAIHRVFR